MQWCFVACLGQATQTFDATHISLKGFGASWLFGAWTWE
jgi:hypothetical protein